MKKIVLWSLLLAISIGINAQRSMTVVGVITDKTGEPIPGVSVVEEGTVNGTISNTTGEYSIILSPESKKLVFSFIGFASQAVEVNGRSKIDIILEDEFTDLDEVVVVGYGEVRKSDLTGAVASVKEKDEVANQYASVDMLLQGRASGIQVTGNSGSPGGAVSVRIRGTNSLRGNNEPLYVVDGVIISTAGTEVSDPSTDSNELQSPQNALTGLNPRDIEKMEILKDASATAIYGSRGANGVVLITTKSGSAKGKKQATVNAFATVEWSTISKKIDLLDGVGFAEYQNESNVIKGFEPKYHIDGGQVYPISNNEGEPVIGENPYRQVNWQDEIYQMAISHNSGLSIAGGAEKSSYYFSAGYTNQKGVVETTDIKRGDLRFNFSQDISNKLKFDTRISLMYQDGSFAQGGSKSGGSRSFTKQVLNYRPLIGDSEAEDEDLDLEVSNPYSWLTDFDDLTRELRINASTGFTYEIIKGLKYKLNAGVDYRKKDRSKFYDTGVFVGQKENGLANYSNLDRYHYVIDNLLMYNKKINKIHQINAVAGFTYDGVSADNKIYEVANFPVKSLRASYPQAGQTVYQPYSILSSEEAIFSVLGRVNYSFRDKYVLTASFRGDQSTKFADGNQWGYYPAMAAAWRVMEEPFIKNLDIFHNLKLRAGWGLTGNQAISPYQTLGTYNTVYYVDAGNSNVIGNVPARIPNPDLTWEKTEQYNAGIDMGFFKGRLNATLDMYYKNTKDLLQEVQLGPSTGFANMFVNRGTIENKGIELAVNGLLVNTKNVTLDLGANISFNRNLVKELGLAPTQVWIDGQEQEAVLYFGNNVSTGTYFKQPANVFMEGQPIGVFWGYKTDGIYQTQEDADLGPTFTGNPNQAGDVMFVDQNGDGNIDDMDKTIIGNPNPDFNYGFTVDFTYKRLSLSALFDGVSGNDIINGYNMELGYAEGQSTNILKETYEQAWRPDAPSNTYPRIGYAYNEYLSDRLVEDGSYLRLNNVTIGYEVPTDWSKNISRLNVYASGRNLFTWTNYSGYDPQITSFINDGTIMGVDWVGAPNVQTFLLGVNVTF